MRFADDSAVDDAVSYSGQPLTAVGDWLRLWIDETCYLQAEVYDRNDVYLWIEYSIRGADGKHRSQRLQIAQKLDVGDDKHGDVGNEPAHENQGRGGTLPHGEAQQQDHAE